MDEATPSADIPDTNPGFWHQGSHFGRPGTILIVARDNIFLVSLSERVIAFAIGKQPGVDRYPGTVFHSAAITFSGLHP